jgi:tetratricopeptide (TPR) repeat protein
MGLVHGNQSHPGGVIIPPMKVAILVCVMAATASAAPGSNRSTKREAIEELEAAARAAHDSDQYTAVGTAYLELYNADPTAPQGDELLYNAGVAFDEGHSLAAAIQAFELVQRQYPRSKIGSRALAHVARIYQSLAMYAEAADKLEQYAKKYAGEKDAFDALSDAVFDRKAIGDREKAIADTEYLIKLFGARRPREAADAMWSLTPVYEADPDRALAHLREYVRSYAAKGDAARIVIAHAMIGQLLWKQSCPVAGVDGLCVKANERAPRTCGTGTVRTSTVIARDPRKRAEALAAFAAAVKEYERRPTNDDPGARHFYAQAQLVAADAELETSLAIAFPRDLSFGPKDSAVRAASTKRFGSWLDQIREAGARVMHEYDAVLSTKDAASSITIGARIGVLSQSFASSLVTGELPRDLRTGAHAADRIGAYCDQMIEAAEPLEARAVDAFAACLAKSSELSWFGESSALCEAELTRLRPAEFPRARELRAEPLLASPVIAGEPALR